MVDDPAVVIDRPDPRAATAGGEAGTAGRAAEAPEVTALVERAKAGDPGAFDGLMLLYERRIIALGMQMGLSRDDALDACQETFLKVFRYIGRFRSGDTFFRWLYRIGVNVVYDQLRKSKSPGVISVEELDPAAAGRLRDTAQSPQERTLAADLSAKILGSLGVLSRQERIVFVLRDLQQIPTDRIGRILGLSQITVRRHCMLARQKLRERVFRRDH
jgi:RNA polymerase sigma-70 factor (ECF subfamily)